LKGVIADERQWKGGGKMGMLTVEQAAQALNVERQTILRFIHEGKLGACKIGHNWRTTDMDVQRFIDGCKVVKKAK
jgi:excisionase family DNA binding protein